MFPRKFSPRFLDSTRSRSFVHIVAPPFVRPLGRGWRICTRPRDSRSPLVPFHQAPFTSPPPLFRFPDFHNFSRSNPILSPSSSSYLFFLSIFPPSFPSVNAVRRLHSSVVIYRNVDGIKMFWASESRVVQPIERKWKGVKGKTPPLSRVQPNIIVLVNLKTIAALRNWQSRKSVIIAM